jgi:hypothetical protein
VIDLLKYERTEGTVAIVITVIVSVVVATKTKKLKLYEAQLYQRHKRIIVLFDDLKIKHAKFQSFKKLKANTISILKYN